MPASSAARTHCGRHVVLDLRAVGEPVAVGDLGDLEAAAAEVAEVHALDPTFAVRRSPRRVGLDRRTGQLSSRLSPPADTASARRRAPPQHACDTAASMSGRRDYTWSHAAPRVLTPRALRGSTAGASALRGVIGTSRGAPTWRSTDTPAIRGRTGGASTPAAPPGASAPAYLPAKFALSTPADTATARLRTPPQHAGGRHSTRARPATCPPACFTWSTPGQLLTPCCTPGSAAGASASRRIGTSRGAPTWRSTRTPAIRGRTGREAAEVVDEARAGAIRRGGGSSGRRPRGRPRAG